jgi:putative lipoic acid-binding regulatory protein
MTDTPRTDEQINGKPCTRFAIMAGDSLRDAMVQSEFARTLERELGQLQAAACDALKHARNGRYSAVKVTDAAESFDALDRILRLTPM